MMDRMTDERPMRPRTPTRPPTGRRAGGVFSPIDYEGDDTRPFLLERIVFFSDAVFAISITLLAIDLRLPDAAAALTGSALADAIADLTPRIVSYAISFAVIGLYWLAHWRRYSAIRSANEGLAVINLIHLGFVAAIPFPTALLGDHGDQALVVVIYALVISGAGVLGSASWLYAARSGLTVGASERWVRLVALRGLSVPIIFLASLPLVLISPIATQAAWLLAFPLQAYVVRRLHVAELSEAGAARAGSRAELDEVG